jgi:hypothetical protein
MKKTNQNIKMIVFKMFTFSFFPYPKDLFIWNIQTHFIPNESYNKMVLNLILNLINY